MIYGIALVVVAAFIGLIVFNMRAGRTRPSEVLKDESHHETPQLTVEEKKQPAIPREETGRNSEPLQKPLVTNRYQEKGDVEYRNALRDFHEKAASSRESSDNQEDAVPGSKSNDDAYREGLRSLTKQD